VGLSYRGSSGSPINYYGAHPDYGQDEVFVLPRGAGGNTPWVNVVDSNIGVNYRLSKDNVVSLTVDVFNLFNLQGISAVDQSYTFQSVYPVKDGTEADLPTETNRGNVIINTGDPVHDREEPTYLSHEEVNPNFNKPAAYQSPRQIRFGLRYTF